MQKLKKNPNYFKSIKGLQNLVNAIKLNWVALWSVWRPMCNESLWKWKIVRRRQSVVVRESGRAKNFIIWAQWSWRMHACMKLLRLYDTFYYSIFSDSLVFHIVLYFVIDIPYCLICCYTIMWRISLFHIVLYL